MNDWDIRIGRFSIPFPFSFPLLVIGFFIGVPLILILGLLSIPGTQIYRHYCRGRERRFAGRLQKLGRVTSLANALAALDDGKGTLIADVLSPKGPTRLWWTPDDIPAICPFPCCFNDWCTDEFDASSVASFPWIRANYTELENGPVILVGEEPDEQVWSKIENHYSKQRRVVITSWMKAFGSGDLEPAA